MTASPNRLSNSNSLHSANFTDEASSPVRRTTAVLACLAATLLSAAPVFANPKEQAAREVNVCKAKYNEALKTALALKVAPAKKQARVDVIYDELATCLRAQRSIEKLPKRLVIVPPKPVAQKPPAPAPAPKKSQWITQPAPQTGTYIR